MCLLHKNYCCGMCLIALLIRTNSFANVFMSFQKVLLIKPSAYVSQC